MKELRVHCDCTDPDCHGRWEASDEELIAECERRGLLRKVYKRDWSGKRFVSEWEEADRG